MNYRKFAFVVLLIMAATSLEAKLIERYKIGFGLSTMKIMGNNPATDNLIEQKIVKNPTTQEPDTVISYGGSLNAIQPGLSLRMTLEPTDDGRHRIPVEIDWTHYSSGERIPVSAYLIINYWHSVHNVSFGTGYHYVFYNLKWARARLYGGIDLKASMFFGSELLYRDRWVNMPSLDTSYVINSKENAFRLGGFARLGVEGDLLNNWSVNSSIAFGSPNLLLRDNKRGELLTPLQYLETKEQIVSLFNVSLMVQYKFNNR